ncbi:MAG TPA: M48 family metalloprotease [Gemmatimonadaceae bacterium]
MVLWCRGCQLLLGVPWLVACDLSIAQEDELGDIYAASIAAQLPIVADSAVNAELTAMGRRLTAVADDASRDWHFHVVDDTVVNAFAVPGGHVFVYRGLVDRAGSYGELAGVVAHEIAHVTLRHSVEQLRARTRTNVLVGLFCTVVSVCGSPVAQVAIDAGGQVLFARHSREDETESDSASVSYLMAAGIDPRAIPVMFTRLAEARQRDPFRLESWFATHPQDGDRIARTAELIAALPMAVMDSLTRDAPEFQRLQSRLAVISRNGP